MAKAKKAAVPAKSAQEARDGLKMGMDISAAQEVAEGAANGQIIGPADPAELLGCQEEADLQDGELAEYTVTAEHGLRLRNSLLASGPP